MNNTIRIAQNRVFRTIVKVLSGDNEYCLGQNEKLIFGLKQFAYSRDYLLQKVLNYADYDIDNHGYLLTLSTEDTNLSPGSYCYDVALQRSDGELEKIIGCTDFEIVRSVVRSDEG